MTYATTRTTIIDLLGTIPEIASVVDYDPDTLDQWPAVTVEAASHQNEFYDTATNRRVISFIIRCYYPLTNGRDQKAEARLCVVVDKILAMLETNVKIEGVWELGRPTRAVWGKDEREMPVRFCDITFTAESRVVRV